MKEIIIIVRPEKLEDIKHILDEVNCGGMTLSTVMGCGTQKGVVEEQGTRELKGFHTTINLLPKIRIEVVVQDQDVEPIIAAVREKCGHIRVLTDDGEKRAAVDRLARKYHPADSQENRDKYIDSEWAPLCMLEMTVEHLSGKQATELLQAGEK